MIDRLAVEDRPRARGVVGDHAADRRAVRGRDVRGEQQAVRLRAPRFRSSSTQPGWTRAQRSSALISTIAVEVLRAVEDHARPDRLPGLRGPAAPRRDRHAEPGAHRDRGRDVGRGRRERDHQRDDLVDAGVGRVQRPVEPIGADVARADGLGQGPVQRRQVDGRRAAAGRSRAVRVRLMPVSRDVRPEHAEEPLAEPLEARARGSRRPPRTRRAACPRRPARRPSRGSRRRPRRAAGTG